MKTNAERKNEIISKLRSLAELEEEREHIDFELEKAVTMNDNDRYYEAVSARVDQDTKINRLMGTIKRMIKKLMNDIYGSWSWIDENDFVEIVSNFKRFA
jgi:hypothetical protein